MQPDILIDGERFSDYKGFVREFNRAYLAVFPGPEWDGQDFGDLDDFLEAPGRRIGIHWSHSQKSRKELGHQAMADFWRQCLVECRTTFPGVVTLHEGYQERIDQATAGQGDTLFDWLVRWLHREDCVVFSTD